MSHINRNRTRLLGRIRRIGGQVAALEQALGSEVGCTQVLTQIAAVRGAVHGLMIEVLQDHLREHLAAEPDAARREKDVADIAALLRTYVK
jgi:DNA-binding FrmR family transcriptional regulator